jgi:hypothetical protein
MRNSMNSFVTAHRNPLGCEGDVEDNDPLKSLYPPATAHNRADKQLGKRADGRVAV